MKAFSHITELGGDGYGVLPAVLLLADRTVLWTPSRADIDNAYKNGKSFLRHEDILEFLSDGYVQIMGRKKWLTDPESRKGHQWKDPSWDINFDGKICDIAIQDKGFNAAEQRVLLVEPERGYTWADQQLKQRSEISRKRKEFLVARIRNRNLPPGILRKIDKLESQEEKLRIALRDIRNHCDAFKLSKSDVTIDGPLWAECLEFVLGNELKKESRFGNVVPSKDHFYAFLDLLLSIASIKNAEHLKKLLCNSKRVQIREEFSKILADDLPVSALLSGEFSQFKEPGILKSIVPNSLIDKGITLSGVAVAIAGLQLAFLPLLGLVIAVSPIAKELAVKYSVLPIKGYKGPMFPFMLAYGVKSPTYKQIAEMHMKVLEHMKKSSI